jgi:hypothetical protein
MNRRILISENERSRILGLHENRRMKEWGLINEKAATVVPAPAAVVTTNAVGTAAAPVVPAPAAVVQAPVAQASFIPTGYDSIEACKAEAEVPKLVASKVFAGQDWEVVKRKWVDSKCNGTKKAF